MPRYVAGNAITLLQNGSAYFPALERAIRAAQHEIYLETYIFADDPTGRGIARALQDAARGGVAVRVIVDGFGSRDYLPEAMRAEMEQAGVQIFIYRPELGGVNLRKHRLRRMHRKIALVDNRIAFVGGINIIDDMHTPKHMPPRFDYAVQVEGPLVQEIRPIVHRLWELLAWLNFKQRLETDEPPPPQGACGAQSAAIVIRDNLRHRDDIEEAYLDAINAARSEILIANAYFLPGIGFRHALMAAAERGVKVTLLLQGRVEYVWLHYASRALYGSLLAGGVQILEYHKSFMHAKVAVIDGEWATVGSSNIDPFSFVLSREANIIVRDHAFCHELRESLIGAIAEGAAPVALQRWNKRPLRERFVAWLAYGLGRFTMGMLGVPQK
jgi:cardiolipin synthase A/B